MAVDASTADTTGDETEKRASSITANYPTENEAKNYTSWQETNTPHLFNFKWKPFSSGINFERLGKFGYK